MTRKEGEILGEERYDLKKILGEGTYGVVWLANDRRLETNVAIKTLHHHMGRLADLQREARTQASLTHRNIARI